MQAIRRWFRSRTALSALAVSLGVATMAVPSSAAVASPGVFGAAIQSAHAEWSIRERGEVIRYFVDVVRVAHPTFGVKTVAYAGRVECPPTSRRASLPNCGEYVPAVEVAPHGFVVDPALSTAQLTFEMDGEPTEVTWGATGPAPRPGHSVEKTPEDRILVNADMQRDAIARGTVLGKNLGVDSTVATLTTGGWVAVHIDDREMWQPQWRLWARLIPR